MGTVLIVDDATFMRVVLKKIVLQSGHEVVEAANGQEAITQFQNTHPDLVLMDIVMPPMPQAKDGIEALKQIMTTDANAKVVMCSSMGQQSLITEALKSGAKDFVIKPFQPQKVMEILAKYFS